MVMLIQSRLQVQPRSHGIVSSAHKKQHRPRFQIFAHAYKRFGPARLDRDIMHRYDLDIISLAEKRLQAIERTKLHIMNRDIEIHLYPLNSHDASAPGMERPGQRVNVSLFEVFVSEKPIVYAA